MRKRQKEGDEMKRNALEWTLYTYTIRSVHDGTTINAKNIPVGNIWNI